MGIIDSRPTKLPSLLCGRQFIIRKETVSAETKELIKDLLLERISLRGICRVLKIPLCWLLNYIAALYLKTPEDLNFQLPAAAELERFLVEADELRSFVSKKAHKRWMRVDFGKKNAPDCGLAYRR